MRFYLISFYCCEHYIIYPVNEGNHHSEQSQLPGDVQLYPLLNEQEPDETQ